MPNLNAAFVGLALVLAVGLGGAAAGQQNTSEPAAASQATPCETQRRSVQDDPNRRDVDVAVDDDDADQSSDWMTQQQVARIVLYDPANFRGRRVGITQDTPDLASRDFSAIASSIRVYHGTWQLCDEANYGGTCRCFSSHTNTNRFGIGNPVSDINLDAEGFGDKVSSIRLIRRTPR